MRNVHQLYQSNKQGFCDFQRTSGTDSPEYRYMYLTYLNIAVS